MTVAIPHPSKTLSTFLGSKLWQHFSASPLQEQWKTLPAYAGFSMGRDAVLAASGGDLQMFVDSLAGEGMDFVLLSATADAPAWALRCWGTDGGLVADGLLPLLQFAGVPRKKIANEHWSVPLDDIWVQRDGDNFLFSSSNFQSDWLDEAWRQVPAADAEDVADLHVWIAGELLRADGYPDFPEDAGESYILGDVHEVLRRCPWLRMDLSLSGDSLELHSYAPVAESFREEFAPFFPPPHEVSLPQLNDEFFAWVAARDLAQWWAGRHRFLSERGLNETVQSDSDLALLFGRDPGSEVFAYLEPEIRLLGAALPAEEYANLSVEYPGGAMGFRFTADAPKDLGEAFANAYLAAVTFTNFEQNGMGETALQMDMQSLPQGRIYSAHYPDPAEGQKAPARNNLSPSLFVSTDGEVWISSSLGLLKEIVEAPRRKVMASGTWIQFQMKNLLPIAERSRSTLVAHRMLEQGGDLAEAQAFVGQVFDAMSWVEQVQLRLALQDQRMESQLQITFAP